MKKLKYVKGRKKGKSIGIFGAAPLDPVNRDARNVLSYRRRGQKFQAKETRSAPAALPFACPGCEKEFATEREHRLHIIQFHPSLGVSADNYPEQSVEPARLSKALICNHCGSRVLNNEDTLRRHLTRRHPQALTSGHLRLFFTPAQ